MLACEALPAFQAVPYHLAFLDRPRKHHTHTLRKGVNTMLKNLRRMAVTFGLASALALAPAAQAIADTGWPH